MKRLLCWIGIHQWGPVNRKVEPIVFRGEPACMITRWMVCQRCWHEVSVI